MGNVTDLRQRLNFVCVHHLHNNGLPRVLFMSDDRRLPDPRSILDHLAPGSGLILRHRTPEIRRELAQELMPRCKTRGIKFIVAADVALALSVDADGVHLSGNQTIRPPLLLKHARERNMIITAAVHNPVAVHRAYRIGVTAALVSPVFQTRSHPDTKPMGILRLAALCRLSPVPLYALGGVNGKTVMRLRHSGIAGIAGIGGIAGAARNC